MTQMKKQTFNRYFSNMRRYTITRKTNAVHNYVVLMLISINLHKKTNEVSIKTRSPPASLSFEDQATKHKNVKWFLVEVAN